MTARPPFPGQFEAPPSVSLPALLAAVRAVAPIVADGAAFVADWMTG